MDASLPQTDTSANSWLAQRLTVVADLFLFSNSVTSGEGVAAEELWPKQCCTGWCTVYGVCDECHECMEEKKSSMVSKLGLM